jgi:nitrite reductase/ring-hydroxylating ferredoxin subunit
MSDAPGQPLLWHQLPHAPAPGTALLHRDAVPDGMVWMHDVPSTAADAPAAVFRLLLLRSGETVRAFANRCAHFGVPLAKQQSQLIFQPHTSITCNVHYARYRWSDGICDRGDCEGESLLPIPVAVDATGHIHIAPVDTP